MTDMRCDYCMEWYDERSDHDWAHDADRLIEVLERIARILEASRPHDGAL